jgi:iron complex outermembrane receptor protein
MSQYKLKPAPRRLAALIALLPLSLAAHAHEAAPSGPLTVVSDTRPVVAAGQVAPKLEPVVVTAPTEADAWASTTPSENELAAGRARSSDTASLLRDVPGVSLYGAGGVSSLPAIHGLADDRLRIRVDGMDLIASCPNHMNPALSYVDPSNVESLKVYAGLSPVSVGGDSIGGSIVAETRSPEFAEPGQGLLTKGEVGAFYRSNGDAHGGNMAATVASDSFSVSYTGAIAKADNYKAGGDFKDFTATGRAGHTLDRDVVGSSAYETRNHTLGFAMRGGNHLLELSLGYQDVPYQLYPNQRMDMLDNEQKRVNLRWLGQFDWGKLEARVYRETVDHYMDFGDDKQLVYGSLTDLNNPAVSYSVVGMPMYTESATNGFSLQGELNLSDRDLLRVGGLLQTYRLDDWWPPAPDCGVGNCIGGMAPLTFWNINDGKRDRKALFGEWEAKWNTQWTSLLGLRVEHVRTDAREVSGYTDTTIPGATDMTMMGMQFGMMYSGSSVGTRDAFNAMDRKRSDTNWDLTAMASYRPSEDFDMKFGFARKTRSPNLYERYSWSTNTMAMVMNNFVGDGNGYVGNPDLKPEVAHTLSLTADWHSADREYQLVVTPYYTLVDDYIDARRNYPGAPASNATATNFVGLQYVNQDARLYGIDLSGKMPLGRSAIGNWGLQGQLSYVDGKNLETGDGLYNIMPLTAKLALTHELGAWRSALEVVGVQSKSDVSDVRNEVNTAGYSLTNLRTSYTWGKVRIDAGVENLFDKLYYLPTGGAYTGQGMTMGINSIPAGIAVPGAGRSFYASVNYKF